MSTEKEKIDSRAVSSTTTSVMNDKSDDSATPGTSKLVVDIPVVVSTSNLEVCIAEGCNNIPIAHPEWDHEYCSIKCCYNHCRSTFQAWLASNKISKTKLNAASTANVPTPYKGAKLKMA